MKEQTLVEVANIIEGGNAHFYCISEFKFKKRRKYNK